MYCKTVHLSGGSEEGYVWELTIHICKNTKTFTGYFYFGDALRKQRHIIRSNDRGFFEARLCKRYMMDKVLHHSWIDEKSEYTKVILLHKSLHSNGGMNVAKEKDLWISKEVWL